MKKDDKIKNGNARKTYDAMMKYDATKKKQDATKRSGVGKTYALINVLLNLLSSKVCIATRPNKSRNMAWIPLPVSNVQVNICWYSSMKFDFEFALEEKDKSDSLFTFTGPPPLKAKHYSLLFFCLINQLLKVLK